MTNARQGWNAAQLASERKTLKKVVHGPVGRRLFDRTVCRGCGHHVCSCAQVSVPPPAPAVYSPATYTCSKCSVGFLSFMNSVVRGHNMCDVCAKAAPQLPSCRGPNCCCGKCQAEAPRVLSAAQAEQVMKETGAVVRMLSDKRLLRWTGKNFQVQHWDQGNWLWSEFPTHENYSGAPTFETVK